MTPIPARHRARLASTHPYRAGVPVGLAVFDGTLPPHIDFKEWGVVVLQTYREGSVRVVPPSALVSSHIRAPRHLHRLVCECLSATKGERGRGLHRLDRKIPERHLRLWTGWPALIDPC